MWLIITNVWQELLAYLLHQLEAYLFFQPVIGLLKFFQMELVPNALYVRNQMELVMLVKMFQTTVNAKQRLVILTRKS
jgi:hypothetical protein